MVAVHFPGHQHQGTIALASVLSTFLDLGIGQLPGERESCRSDAVGRRREHPV